MKKYLMIGFATIAFASCSNHDIETVTPEQRVKNEYEAKFIAAFGQPASNQNWGFSKTAGAITRAVTPTDANYQLTNQAASLPSAPDQPSFRGKPGKPTFNATVPANTPEATSTTNLEANASYQIKSGDLNQPQNFKNMTLYVVDNVTWSGQVNKEENGTTFIITEGKTLTYNQGEALNLKIYMAPNSHLVIGNWVQFKKEGAMLYVGKGCTVTCGENVTFAERYTVLNEGTFTANKLNIEEGTLFYNDGSLTANTSITIQKTNKRDGETDAQAQGAELVNNSTLTTPSITLQAGGGMLNEEDATVTVNGLTYLYNTNSYWMNNGDYTTQNLTVDNINKVWNNCKLTVHKSDNTGTFTLGNGSQTQFALNGNNSIQTDKMVWGNNADFYMKDNSLLEVLGESKAVNANKNHGLHGLGTGYSIFKAGSVTYQSKAQNCMNYYGNIFVDTDNHFAQELTDKSSVTEVSDQPTFYFNTSTKTVKFKFYGDSCPITSTIAAGKCYHGYTPPTSSITYQGRIMAEDLTVNNKSDWDFNDVVFDWAIIGGKAYIKLLAAGGTLPLTIGGQLNDEGTEVVGGVEVHNKFGVSNATMVNTGLATAEIKEFVLDDKINYTDNDANAIKLYVKKGTEWVEITAEQGKPAGKFNCPVGTKWCEEYANITKVYTNFAAWVANTSVNWAVNPTDKYVDYQNVNENKNEQ